MVLGEAGQIVTMCDAIEQSLGEGFVEFDAVVSFWLNRGASIAAELKRRHPHLSCFSRGHGGDIYAERSGLKHLPMQRTALRRLDGIVSVSEAGANYLTSRYPELSSKTTVGRLGVDDQVACSPSQDGVLRIMSISNLIPLKRVNLIAEALVCVKRPVKWSHIGDGDERVVIEEVLERVGSNVEVCLLGQLPHESVIDWLGNNEVDIFLNVSTTEGLPVAIMEAFSFGIPVIATDVGGTSEIVDDSCGILLSANFTPKELGEILEKWNSTNLTLRVGAIDKQQGFFSSVKNETAFASLISDTIERRRRG
jgi:glycosyltransferase involved in cell wall biosynthesis